MGLSTNHYLDLVGGKFAETSPLDLEAMFQALANSPQRSNLVVHFHGGRVGRGAALRSAETVLAPAFLQAGSYPAFFVWNSDEFSTVRAQYESIAQDDAFLRFIRRIARFAFGSLNPLGEKSGGPATIPMEDIPEDPQQLETYLREKEKTQPPPADEEALQQAQEQLQHEMETDDQLLEELQRSSTLRPKDAQGERAGLSLAWLAVKGVQVLAAVVYRRWQGRHHGVYDTIVQETVRALGLADLGIAIWNAMKKCTADAFGGNPTIHGGTAFLERLQAYWHKDLRVTLVGHSTGAIFIGHFLERADATFPPAAQFDVVLLAPACSFKFLAAEKRLKAFQNRVRHWRNFGLVDERERSYWEVPLLARGSLLYIVAGLLEAEEVDMPLLGMQRYHTGAAPYDGPDVMAVRQLLREAPLWAMVDGGPGKTSHARTHGGLSEEAWTLASLQHILSKGF